jgi:hypothetical protein
MSAMRLGKTIAISTAGVAAAVALCAAAKPPLALSQAAPGLWEVTGVPGAKAIRQCLGDVLALAQFEHRTENCERHVIRDGVSSTTVEYSCPGGGFGRSELGVITPRSLRIDTQGISGDLPFHYVAQARRVGDCPSHQTASRH